MRAGVAGVRAMIAVAAVLTACGGREARGTGEQDERVTGPTGPAAADGNAKAVPQIAEYVVEVFEDRRGTLWFGTMNRGVARYDGKALTYVTTKDGLCGDTVVSIAEDRTGTLWFGTHSGVCSFDGHRFTAVLRGEGAVRADRDGDVWVSQGQRVYRQDGGRLVELVLPLDRSAIRSYGISAGRVSMALEDRRGNVWFATDGYGALRFDGTRFAHFGKRDGLSSDSVVDIVEDARGDLWFACMQAYQPAPTDDGGVARYDGETFTRFPQVAGLSGNDIHTIKPERSGRLWIGAPGHGAYRFDGKTFELFDRSDRRDLIERFGVQGILEDRSGTLWFGFSGGLFRFDGATFRNVTQTGPWPPA